MFFRLGIWTGKLAGFSSQAIGMNGTSIPGMVGGFFDWKMLKKLGEQVKNIIVVTGTNGKTTTSNLLSSVFEQTDYKFIDNNAGSNLITGVTSCFIEEADGFGKIKNCDYAILEVDEVTLVKVLKQITPSAIIVTNFFRDQLDRYTEIDVLIRKMEESIRPINTKLILNADDPFSYRLSKLGKETVYFGVDKNAYTFEQQEISESKFCPDCGTELIYNYTHYGQLGYYSCGNHLCFFERPKAKYEVDKIFDNEGINIEHNKNKYKTNLKGPYNSYNLMATIACAKEFNLEEETIIKGIKNFEPDNGRMQSFICDNKPYVLNLAKNPQGVNSTLSTFLQNKEEKQIVLFLNDLGADGKDVSWIWDADYETLNRKDVKQIICSGIRATDMAIRIKYAGIPEEKIKIVNQIPKAIDMSVKKPMNTYLISNYTPLEYVKEVLEEHDKISIPNDNFVVQRK